MREELLLQQRFHLLLLLTRHLLLLLWINTQFLVRFTPPLNLQILQGPHLPVILGLRLLLPWRKTNSFVFILDFHFLTCKFWCVNCLPPFLPCNDSHISHQLWGWTVHNWSGQLLQSVYSKVSCPCTCGEGLEIPRSEYLLRCDCFASIGVFLLFL